MSVASDGTQATGESLEPVISADGSRIGFRTRKGLGHDAPTTSLARRLRRRGRAARARRGVDARPCKQSLLLGMQIRVPGALQVQPLTQADAGTGKSSPRIQQPVFLNVASCLVVGALPQGRPWRVPPRIQRTQRGTAPDRHVETVHALVGHPLSQ
ncbi:MULTISPECIES: hypothetical protein [Streptomyces violaceusniger group]|uniref:hypothetical protein n=1 Tax=Streptomyces violaceusniger group TaxID=2839105 RepID=UPI00117D7E6D|nr:MULTISPECIES: hypothetical protein [Streptomyces violaceusniger group]